MNNISKCILGTAVALVMSLGASLHAQKGTAKINVSVNQPGHKISPMLFGVFFEDINLSADGGIYPELVRNRSFEDADTLQNWKFVSADKKSSALISDANFNARPPVTPLNPFNRKSLQVKADGDFKLENKGYYGMNLVQGQSYTFKVALKTTPNAGYEGSLQVKLLSSKGENLASGELKNITAAWGYQTLNLKPEGTDPKGYLEITGNGKGSIYMDMVSLLPDATWKGHGLRPDLAEAMNALSPRFLRFPGGCWVEGEDMSRMNKWKETIGNIDTRTPLWNIWRYNATNSLGYHEYLQLAEDLGAEPMYCINAGMSHRETIPMDQMGQWVQDALDAIEYANGPVNSVWGAIRAKNGHPAPFNMKYLEIGNENGQEPYAERWKLMAEAIHTKYPDIILIANEWAGGHPKDPKPQIVDEHYYNNPDWFIWNAGMYDQYDRKGSKIFVGEYAVTSKAGNGNLRGAIGEAAFMTGLERNSDIVEMAAYAPLFCNANHKAWPINLINFDSYRWYGIPGYYVQQMFANNQGTVNLPVKIENAPFVEAPYASGAIGLGTWNNAAEFKDLVVTSPTGKVLYKGDFSKNIDNWRKTEAGKWSVENGVLTQSAIATGVTAFVGDTAWKDYTITLKARKLNGENGFQIYFHNRNNTERTRWDLGGYGNSVHLMDMGVVTESTPAGIEEGRWYDIKIEIKGNGVRGYLDGKLIQDVTDAKTRVNSLTASAAHDEKTGDIIVKVVNASFKPVSTGITLSGAANLAGSGVATVLTSGSALDENTLEQPLKVAPKTEPVKVSGNAINRVFPANSLTVLRIPVKK